MPTLLSGWLLAALAGQQPHAGAEAFEDLPLIVVEGPLLIEHSCLLRIPPDQVVADPTGEGALRIRGAGLTVAFEAGSVLHGAPADLALDQLQGVGILAEEAPDLLLVGAAVEGYRIGVRLSRCDRAEIDGAHLARNYAQRLHSTPAAEDQEDWLFPHANDDLEWERHHGAGLSIHRSREVRIHDVVVREQQNGILLDRVDGAQIYDNDASFLSGWGLAMWRSSDNLISRNAFDFCVRGYSHGVYNRGQDAAGLLMFEQCSRNVIVENSVTHGGDGLFAFAGKEALGEVPGPEGFDYHGAGNNDNVIVGNDFSFAAAHGLELTFSFRNLIADNRFEGNAICGIWGGFSRQLTILGNRFIGNGEQGYGLERGGIDIDHPGELQVIGNLFRGDRCGVHLWWLGDAFADTPWGQANLAPGARLRLADNDFDTDGPCLQLRGELAVDLLGGSLKSSGEALQLEEGAALAEGATTSAMADLRQLAEARVAAAYQAARGRRQPFGQRRRLGGREAIVMTEWGPWDHQRPFLQRMADRADGAHGYRLMPASAQVEELAVLGAVSLEPVPGPEGTQWWILPDEDGLIDYRLEVKTEAQWLYQSGRFLTADWRVTVFPTPEDPRQDQKAWAAAAAGNQAQEYRLRQLHLPYGQGGADELFGSTGMPKDHFGTLARGVLRLPAGRWRLRLRSDDGVRLYLDGERVIDDWTWHAPREATWDIKLPRARSLPIRIEHFELDGYAWLSLEVEAID